MYTTLSASSCRASVVKSCCRQTYYKWSAGFQFWLKATESIILKQTADTDRLVVGTSWIKAMAERVKVGSAYICVDGDPSCAADWPGVMNLCITVHRQLILRERYFAQSNYSSIFTQQRLSSIQRSIRVKMSPASDNRSDKHARKCARVHKWRESEGREGGMKATTWQEV